MCVGGWVGGWWGVPQRLNEYAGWYFRDVFAFWVGNHPGGLVVHLLG